MKNYKLDNTLVILAGWFVILMSAALVLPPARLANFSVLSVVILVATIVWLLLTAVSIGVHLFRGWRLVLHASTGTPHIVWLGLQTFCVLLVVGALAFNVFSSRNRDTVPKMREAVLLQDLYMLRSVVHQFSNDLHRRPQSLADLVQAGYLKQIPRDPMTRRSDSWVLEWSNESENPGIINVRSGSQSISSKGTPYSNW